MLRGGLCKHLSNLRGMMPDVRGSHVFHGWGWDDDTCLPTSSTNTTSGVGEDFFWGHGPGKCHGLKCLTPCLPGHVTPFNQAQPTRNPLSLSQFLISQGRIHGSNVNAEMLTSSKQACHVTTMHAADSFCTPSLPMFVMQQNLCPLASSETRCGECMHLSV